MQVRWLGMFKVILTLIIGIFANSFESRAQIRGVYIVEQYFENDILQEDAIENGMELSIVRSLKDDFYYFTNEWFNVGTYSTGVMYNWEEVDNDVAFDFEITKDDQSVHAYEFTWKFENSYDKDKGQAEVLFIDFMDECDHYFICVVTIKAKDLVLRYEGYRE